MADADDDKVQRLPVRFKAPPGADEPQLRVVESYGDDCNHSWYFEKRDGMSGTVRYVTYMIREGETEVECSRCHLRLDPVWVLKKLAHHESKYRETQKRYVEEVNRLSERSRTKCEHCQKMTRISRR